MNIADIRKSYEKAELSEAHSQADPLMQFDHWLKEAIASEVPEPNAMTVATVGPDLRPSTRVVLIKGYDERGIVWYTNYESQKGQELAGNPYAALQFHWVELERVVRIEGLVEKVSDADSDAYYASRPLDSRIGAWASPQSQVIPGRAWLVAEAANACWTFTRWEGDLSGTNPVELLTVTRDMDVTAVFTQERHTLTVNKTGPGQVAVTPQMAEYYCGDSITLTATPSPNFFFTGWSGDLTGAENPLTFTIEQDTVVTATFSNNPPPIVEPIPDKTIKLNELLTFTVRASDPGGTTVTLQSGATIPAGSCTLAVDVVSTVAGSYVNVIAAGQMQTSAGNNQNPATATLAVGTNALVPPTVSKVFSPGTIAVDGVSTLTITLGNANTSALALNADFTDTLPTGVTVATTPGIGGTCTTGDITATAGGSTITYVNSAIIPVGGCTITVNVTSSTGGSYTNIIPSGVGIGLQTDGGYNPVSYTHLRAH